MNDALRTRRDALAAELRRWNADEDKPVKSTRQLLGETDRAAAEMRRRDEEDRLEEEIERRVELRLVEERAKQKPPIYRRDLRPREKSQLIEKLGHDKYMALPWAPPR
jgi:hypothetical protein